MWRQEIKKKIKKKSKKNQNLKKSKMKKSNLKKSNFKKSNFKILNDPNHYLMIQPPTPNPNTQPHISSSLTKSFDEKLDFFIFDFFKI